MTPFKEGLSTALSKAFPLAGLLKANPRLQQLLDALKAQAARAPVSGKPHSAERSDRAPV